MSEGLSPWIAVADELPPDHVVVETALDADTPNERNRGPLMRVGGLWFYRDASMYVYYTPTHWRPLT